MYLLTYCVRLIFKDTDIKRVAITGECRLYNSEKRAKPYQKHALFESFTLAIPNNNLALFWKNFIRCMKQDRVRGWFDKSKRRYKSDDIEIIFERDMQSVAGFDDLDARFVEMVKICTVHYYDTVAYIKTLEGVK